MRYVTIAVATRRPELVPCTSTTFWNISLFRRTVRASATTSSSRAGACRLTWRPTVDALLRGSSGTSDHDAIAAVVSASANCKDVLEAAGIADLLEARVDGVVARELGLPGKPAPDTFLKGAELLGLDPADCAVFEDAQAGVAAGRAGGFGIVIGVDRVGQADALREHGADVVVADLAELLTQ